MRWEDLSVGTTVTPLVLGPLTRTDFVRYQGASGDMNPIHHDETVARSAGYEAPLAVGMFHAGALAAHAAGWLGPERVRRTRIRWSEQVWPGDVLTITGQVTRTYQEAGERRADVELACARQTGGVALRGVDDLRLEPLRVRSSALRPRERRASRPRRGASPSPP